MEELAVEKRGISIFGAFGLVILIFIIQVLLYIPVEIIGMIIRRIGLNNINSYINIAGEIFVNLGVVYFLIKRIRKKEEFNLKVKYKPNYKEYIFALLFLAAHILIFGNTLGILIDKIEVSQWVVEAFDEMFINPIIAFLSICVIAPIFEEIIYRGIILEQLSKKYNSIISVTTSAVIFGLIHANLHQSVNAFFIGLIIGFIYIKTNSLLLCIFWHFANNFLVFISSMYITEAVSDVVLTVSIFQLLLGIILLIASFIFFNWRKDDSDCNISET